jgi:hypothetical protein
MSRKNLLLLIRSLRQSASLAGVTLLADNSVNIKGESALQLSDECFSCHLHPTNAVLAETSKNNG